MICAIPLRTTAVALHRYLLNETGMINPALLLQRIADGYVQVQTHPTAPYSIYNYTPRTQFERAWDEVTLACRGLILDAEYQVVARPFAKFFNMEEVPAAALPAEPFEVYEKMDGSLGVLYWLDGQPYIASRGSFTSPQSQKANALLYSTYAHALPHLDPAQTYLFEIIYPENRIVVNYGDREELVLLAAIDRETGTETLPEIGFPVVKRYDGINDLGQLRALEEDNREGFVVRFRSGLRVKAKFAEYVRLHRLITEVSTLTIWEHLRDNRPLDDLLERVPDEFYHWVKATLASQQAAFDAILATAQAEFRVLDTRRETAEYFKQCQHPNLMFFLLDGKTDQLAQAIWKRIRPTFSKPFFQTEVA